MAVGIVLVAVLVTIAVRSAAHSSSEITTSKSGAAFVITYPADKQRSPSPVDLKRLGGGAPVQVGGATGRPTVLNFFASWCPVCQRELGAIASVASEGRVRFIGVDTDDDAPSTALSLLHKAHATYPVGIGKGPLAEEYGTANLPTTAFLNAKGKVVALVVGGVKKDQLASMVAKLLAGKPL